MDVVPCCGVAEWDGASSLVDRVSTHPKQMTRVGLSGGAPWHGVAGLVHDNHSTHMAKVELDSGRMCLNTTPTQPPSQATCIGCEPLPWVSSHSLSD